MPIVHQTNNRAYVSLSVLAEDILGLSRARVYELIERGALPMPIYCIRTKRPLFDRELQDQAMQVRQSGVGINGQPLIFYRPRTPTTVSPSVTPRCVRPRAQTAAAAPNRHADLIAGLQGLGITATEASVTAALAAVFPNGTASEQEADILRSLFRHFRRPHNA